MGSWECSYRGSCLVWPHSLSLFSNIISRLITFILFYYNFLKNHKRNCFCVHMWWYKYIEDLFNPFPREKRRRNPLLELISSFLFLSKPIKEWLHGRKQSQRHSRKRRRSLTNRSKRHTTATQTPRRGRNTREERWRSFKVTSWLVVMKMSSSCGRFLTSQTLQTISVLD